MSFTCSIYLGILHYIFICYSGHLEDPSLLCGSLLFMLPEGILQIQGVDPPHFLMGGDDPCGTSHHLSVLISQIHISSLNYFMPPNSDHLV